jgi:MAP/microtubule affinity-regulating kinase
MRSSCSQPNIVRIYDVIESDRKVFLFLELISGGELFNEILRRGCIPEAEARYIFYQILQALKVDILRHKLAKRLL